MTASRCPLQHPAERGMVLIPVLLVALLLGGLAMSLVEEGMGERTAVLHHASNMRALELCEVGLVKSELEIVTNTDHDGGGIGNVSGEVNGGSYRVEAEKIPHLLGRYVLLARGEHALSVRRVEVGLKVHGGLFSYALFGKDSVEFAGGGQTDSFDSRLGTWASQAVNGVGSFDGIFARTNGTVGSNMNVKLWNNAAVRGGAHPGPTGSFAGDPDDVWGELSNLTEPVDLPPPEVEGFLEALAANDNDQIDPAQHGVTYDAALRKLRVGAGAVLLLTGGTYLFSEITTVGGGSVRVTAPATIYVTGMVDFGGGALTNATGVASNLIVYVHPYDIIPGYDPFSATDVEMTGGTNSAYSVYAPTKHVKISGGNDIFGAVLGATIEVQGGSRFHYDEALADWGYGDGKLGRRLYWVELGGHNH